MPVAVVTVLVATLAAGCGASAPAPTQPTGDGSVAVTLELVAESLAFDRPTLSAPADEPFAIRLVNRDRSVPHDVDISRAGTTVADNPVIGDAGEITYVIPALVPGQYEFICSVHPIPAMTGTLVVE